MKNKILIVEDTAQDCEALMKKLEHEPYELLIARDGAAALAIVDSSAPDLIILDILLPDIDGFEICRRIRANPNYLSVPILFHTTVNTLDEKLIGLQLGASDFLTKDADERELLVRVRNLLAAKQRIDERIALSVIDGLTQVYSKMYFQYRIGEEFERCRRYKREFCCVIIDIDGFKNINDAHGFVTGNAVLRKVAGVIKQNIRDADVLCRYGGDEFGWLLPETKFDDAYLAAERLRHFMLTADVGVQENALGLTISCGVSSYAIAGGGTDELFFQATEALRKAKSGGRNQTRVFGKDDTR